MKKIISVALVLVMVLSFMTACASTADKIIGEWKTTIKEMGIEIETTYTFNEDGTGKMTAAGIPIDFKYTVEDDKLTMELDSALGDLLGSVDKEEYTVKFEGGKLLMTQGNETQTFERVEK